MYSGVTSSLSCCVTDDAKAEQSQDHEGGSGEAGAVFKTSKITPRTPPPSPPKIK